MDFSQNKTPLGLSAGLDAAEQRTEPYVEYGEGAAQAGTTPSAKSTSSVAGFAGQQAGAAEGVSEHTGFPNPATDTNIISLDLGALLIKHPSSTFFMQIAGNAWEDLGVFGGDVAIIDKALEPKPNDLVVWWEGQEFCVSYQRDLLPQKAAWGVITSIIHRYHV